MFIYILMAVIFFVFGTLFAFKKGGFLIAGFSTAENPDTKKIYRIMTVTCYINFITSFIGIFVNKGFYMVGILFPILVLSVIIAIVMSNWRLQIFILTLSIYFDILSSIADVNVMSEPIPPFGGTEATTPSLTSVFYIHIDNEL